MVRKSFMGMAVTAALAVSSAAWAGPVLVLDLQVDTGNSASSLTPSGVYAVTGATVGQTVNLDVWGIVTDNPSYSGTTLATISGDGISTSAGRFVSTEGATAVTGNFQTSVKNSVLTQGTAGVSHAAYDGVGGNDWGGAYPSTSNTGYFNPASIGYTAFNSGTTLLLGTIQFVITAAPQNGTTLLTEIPFINSTSGRSGYNFKLGGSTFSNSSDPASANLSAVDTNQRIKSGQGVLISAPAGDVPEPASLGVLALGGLALLARRRKTA